MKVLIFSQKEFERFRSHFEEDEEKLKKLLQNSEVEVESMKFSKMWFVRGEEEEIEEIFKDQKFREDFKIFREPEG